MRAQIFEPDHVKPAFMHGQSGTKVKVYVLPFVQQFQKAPSGLSRHICDAVEKIAEQKTGDIVYINDEGVLVVGPEEEKLIQQDIANRIFLYRATKRQKYAILMGLCQYCPAPCCPKRRESYVHELQTKISRQDLRRAQHLHAKNEILKLTANLRLGRDLDD